ncbi:hypothetical protein B0H94_107165 [Salsuginibacillus halophilus]|uniref:Uncharacterized protein n=1 Tax=Salsuginibacillus halophilus TaxID=517424 RepID=A0A2P8HG37_9BACI|nr:hypothetical protein [Salsuginibacillus halophilus]PSL45160.1 hypothetical protein B0H94_107165 [Salsuginibacillus halophilus]
MFVVLFVILSGLYLFIINSMTNTLCVQREISDERVPKVFRTVNILIMILLTSTYVKVLFT